MKTKVINVTDGMREYIGGTVTERFGANISDTVFQVGLGGYDQEHLPDIWTSPDLDSSPTSSKRKIDKLIDGSAPLGVHYLWIRVQDNPEIIPLRVDIAIVVI